MHYIGDDNDEHDFWLELNSSRIHCLNWGSENNKELTPPRFMKRPRLIPEAIKEKVQNCGNSVSNTVLQMVNVCILLTVHIQNNFNNVKIKITYIYNLHVFIFVYISEKCSNS